MSTTETSRMTQILMTHSLIKLKVRVETRSAGIEIVIKKKSVCRLKYYILNKLRAVM